MDFLVRVNLCSSVFEVYAWIFCTRHFHGLSANLLYAWIAKSFFFGANTSSCFNSGSHELVEFIVCVLNPCPDYSRFLFLGPSFLGYLLIFLGLPPCAAVREAVVGTWLSIVPGERGMGRVCLSGPLPSSPARRGSCRTPAVGSVEHPACHSSALTPLFWISLSSRGEVGVSFGVRTVPLTGLGQRPPAPPPACLPFCVSWDAGWGWAGRGNERAFAWPTLSVRRCAGSLPPYLRVRPRCWVRAGVHVCSPCPRGHTTASPGSYLGLPVRFLPRKFLLLEKVSRPPVVRFSRLLCVQNFDSEF